MKRKRKQKEVSLRVLAQRAFKSAIARATEEHRRAGVPMVVWKDGKIVKISGNKLPRQRIR